MKKNAGKNKSNLNSDPLVCLCNEISKSKIDAAMMRGCTTLQKIAAATTAGAGQCGGSCQPQITKLVEHFMATGELLDTTKYLESRKTQKR